MLKILKNNSEYQIDVKKKILLYCNDARNKIIIFLESYKKSPTRSHFVSFINRKVKVSTKCTQKRICSYLLLLKKSVFPPERKLFCVVYTNYSVYTNYLVSLQISILRFLFRSLNDPKYFCGRPPRFI